MNCQCRLSFFRPVLFDVSADAGRAAGIKKKRAFVFVCLCFVSISIWNNFTLRKYLQPIQLNFDKMASEIPRVKFDNSYECPILGIGTWKVCSNQLRRITVLAEWEVRRFSISARKSWVWMPVIFSTCNWWILSIMTTENLFLLASTFPLHIHTTNFLNSKDSKI